MLRDGAEELYDITIVLLNIAPGAKAEVSDEQSPPIIATTLSVFINLLAALLATPAGEFSSEMQRQRTHPRGMLEMLIASKTTRVCIHILNAINESR